MTEHPITPPPELVQRWDNECVTADMPDQVYIATQAARWGSDQELEACLQWIQDRDWTWHSGQLRAARRPKPPSLKEQALKALNCSVETSEFPKEYETIRRALEALPDAN